MVPESVANPIAYYKNNTANSLARIDAAGRGGIKHIVFLVNGSDLWQSGRAIGGRGCRSSPYFAVRDVEADDGNDVARCGIGERS